MFVPTETGHWVSEQFARLAEILKDYDDGLELRWIPPEMRTSEDGKPYAIVHRNPQGYEYVVKYAGELDNPQRILADLWAGDTSKGNVLGYLDSLDAANDAFRMKKQVEQAEERQEFIEYLMRTDKNFIKTDNPITGEKGVKLDSQLRRRE